MLRCQYCLLASSLKIQPQTYTILPVQWYYLHFFLLIRNHCLMKQYPFKSRKSAECCLALLQVCSSYTRSHYCYRTIHDNRYPAISSNQADRISFSFISNTERLAQKLQHCFRSNEKKKNLCTATQDIVHEYC